MLTNIRDHLKNRNMNIDLYPTIWLDDDNCLATFPLFNLSGKLVGYQQYNPNGDKQERKNAKDGKYFTYATKVDKKAELAVWGLETLDTSKRRIYVVEGIFKACRLHNHGLNAIAVLGNNPKPLKQWLFSLGYEMFCICDGDVSGKKLSNFGHRHIILPDGVYLDEMSEEDLGKLISMSEKFISF